MRVARTSHVQCVCIARHSSAAQLIGWLHNYTHTHTHTQHELRSTDLKWCLTISFDFTLCSLKTVSNSKSVPESPHNTHTHTRTIGVNSIFMNSPFYEHTLAHTHERHGLIRTFPVAEGLAYVFLNSRWCVCVSVLFDLERQAFYVFANRHTHTHTRTRHNTQHIESVRSCRVPPLLRRRRRRSRRRRCRHRPFVHNL